MKLSVVVVNYNKCALLRQGLNALVRACKYIDYEIIVIDNNSTDASVAMLHNDFPEIKTIQNPSSLGLAGCRNIGINQSRGEYVLLVNADTICGKKTLENVLEFMDVNAAGAIYNRVQNRFHQGMGRSFKIDRPRQIFF